MKKFTAFICILTVLSLLFGACGTAQQPSEEPSTEAPTETTVPPTEPEPTPADQVSLRWICTGSDANADRSAAAFVNGNDFPVRITVENLYYDSVSTWYIPAGGMHYVKVPVDSEEEMDHLFVLQEAVDASELIFECGETIETEMQSDANAVQFTLTNTGSQGVHYDLAVLLSSGDQTVYVYTTSCDLLPETPAAISVELPRNARLEEHAADISALNCETSAFAYTVPEEATTLYAAREIYRELTALEDYGMNHTSTWSDQPQITYFASAAYRSDCLKQQYTGTAFTNIPDEDFPVYYDIENDTIADSTSTGKCMILEKEEGVYAGAYIGEVVDGQQEGTGTWFCSSETIDSAHHLALYQGAWAGGYPNGKGRVIICGRSYELGDVVEVTTGTFKDGYEDGNMLRQTATTELGAWEVSYSIAMGADCSGGDYKVTAEGSRGSFSGIDFHPDPTFYPFGVPYAMKAQ